MQIAEITSTNLSQYSLNSFSIWASISRHLPFQIPQVGLSLASFYHAPSRREVGVLICLPFWFCRSTWAYPPESGLPLRVFAIICKFARKPCCCLHFTSNKLKGLSVIFFNHSAVTAARSEPVKQLHWAHQLSRCFLPQTPHSRTWRNQ